MNEFKRFHPLVNFIYFVFAIGFSCFFMHPLCLMISLVCGFVCSAMLKGKKAVRNNFIYMALLVFGMAIVNPLFNHDGATIIKYLPDGNPLTLESVIYGVAAACMIISVIFHFSCYNEVMTSDKFIYLFGKIIPSLSLIFSMTLRFVPKFTGQMKVVINAQRCMGRDISKGSLINRIKVCLAVISIMTTWSLENAVETADSMRARGWGLPKRSAFSIFTLEKRDIKALFVILILGIYILTGYFCGGMYFRFFPSIKVSQMSLFEISLYVSYAILFACPIIIELWEVMRWKLLRSKI